MRRCELAPARRDATQHVQHANNAGTSMNRMPQQQWSALSALYEEADALPPEGLALWLARLEAEQHPLLPQLQRMLQARALVETDDFLNTMPRLPGIESRIERYAAGRRIGPYRLLSPLGEGGMAEVWLAERDDGAFRRQVAIKLPYPRLGRDTFAARFDRERDILATLRHPHIAGLLDAGVTPDGQAWLALEYVEASRSRTSATNDGLRCASASSFFARCCWRSSTRMPTS
jgi:hypothetical protein